MTFRIPARYLGFVLAIPLVVGLQACANVDIGQASSSIKLLAQKTPEERKEDIKAFREGTSWYSEGIWNGALGEYMIYMPANYKDIYAKDEESFFNYVMGAYLARNPSFSYTEFTAYAGDFISRERFDYMRRFGDLWLKSLETDPRNRAIKQRYDLFKKRFGGDNARRYQELVIPSRLSELLKDDAKFKSFLEDDAYAANWILENTDTNTRVRGRFFEKGYGPSIDDLLKPVTIGILPALAS
ncbi:MAG: hypothetical protein O9315_17410 [Beijerinckiaceae bacterium]|nr:hypothetical protein [Brevundimonas sp.]MCZ8302023.1 hypothetical protein [Beijerinckiaceae bacterium]